MDFRIFSWASKHSPGDFFAASFSSRDIHIQRRGSFNGLRRDGIWLDTIPWDSEFIPWWTRCDKLTSRLPGSHLILFGCFSYERWTSNNRRSPSTLLRLKRVTWWHASKKASQNERSMNWSNIWMKDYIRSEEFWHWHWHSPSLMAFVFFFLMLTWWVMNPLFTDRLLTCFLRELSSSTTCMFWSNPGFQKTMNNAWDRYCKTSMLENKHLSTFPPYCHTRQIDQNSGWTFASFNSKPWRCAWASLNGKAAPVGKSFFGKILCGLKFLVIILNIRLVFLFIYTFFGMFILKVREDPTDF